MSKQHQAVFLDGAKKPVRVGPIDTKSPGKGEVLIRSKAIAINPVDWKVQETGWFIDSWPAILGEDVAGEVVEVGDDVTNIKAGDRVMAHSPFLINKVLQAASFQELVLVSAAGVAIIPDNVKFEDATVLPLAISTAAAGLYQSKDQACLGLDLPSHSPEKSGKTILIWGGSSSVGTAAIQLATASGVTVITTCSPRNNDLVTKLGAKPFDYNSPSVVGDLVEELKKGEFAGAYDSKFYSYFTVYANIGQQLVVEKVVCKLHKSLHNLEAELWQMSSHHQKIFQLTLRVAWVSVSSLLATGLTITVFALTIFAVNNAHVGKAVWSDFVPKALASGQLVTAPIAQVVGNGLDAIQDACDKQKAGVSAKKIVVTV